MTTRRVVLTRGLSLAASPWLARSAKAQDARPLTIVVGFAAGGAPDIVARALAPRLQETLRRPVVVENRTGAAGQLALAAIQNGPADGSLYVLTPPGMLTAFPSMYAKLPYTPADIEPVVSACTFEFGIAGGPASGARSWADHAAWLKANPDKNTFGVPGLGTTPHFLGLLLGQAQGSGLRPLAYRGGPPMVQDLVGGQIPLAINVLANFTELHRTGKARVLATTGAKRSTHLGSEVPTLTELGYKQAESEEWFSFFARRGTPASETRAFAEAVQVALEHPGVRSTLAAGAFNPVAMSATQLARNIAEDTRRWSTLIRDTGFKLES